MSSFHNIKGELTLPPGNDLNLRGTRLVIPHTLQTRTLAIAHEGHQSLVGTKHHLREKVWSPGTDHQADVLLKSCLACQAITPTKTAHQQPLKLSELPPGPRLHVSSMYVVLHLMTNISSSSRMDEYSLYSLVDVDCSTSAIAMIPELDNMFCMFLVKSENV